MAQPMGDGCLKMSDVEHVVSTECGLPTVYIPYLVRLLEKFHVAFSQGKDRILLLNRCMLLIYHCIDFHDC